MSFTFLYSSLLYDKDNNGIKEILRARVSEAGPCWAGLFNVSP